MTEVKTNNTKSGLLLSLYLSAGVAILLLTIYNVSNQCEIDKKYLEYESTDFCNFNLTYSGLWLCPTIIIGLYLLVRHFRSGMDAKAPRKHASHRVVSLAMLAPVPSILSAWLGYGLTEEYLVKQCYEGAQETVCAHGMASVEAGRPLGVIWIALGIAAIVLAFVYKRNLSKDEGPK